MFTGANRRGIAFKMNEQALPLSAAAARFETPRVSVVIITRNQRAFLMRSLPLLSAQKGFAGAGSPEIIVVDSGSTDGAQSIVREQGARLLSLPPASFTYARAHNAGAREATGEIVVRLSGDAVPAQTDWLQRLVEPFRDPQVAATWGRQILPPGVCNYVEQGFEAILRPASRGPRRYYRSVTPLGSGMAVRRTLWEAHPYDERLPQAEDYAFLRCVMRRGFAGVFVPDAPIIHGHPETVFRALRRSLTQSVVQGLILTGFYDTRLSPLPPPPSVDAPQAGC